jgi:hypothetical protein
MHNTYYGECVSSEVLEKNEDGSTAVFFNSGFHFFPPPAGVSGVLLLGGVTRNTFNDQFFGL